ncbi:MAG: PIN domain-containing protein [Acidimicrobiales bacterium]|nr:PIN domain-containing protein [Acidimicrobiales bacterium]
MRRIFVDTSVLFPFSVMDLLLALTENGLHHVLWTDELLDEWERVIVRERKRTAASAASITAAIRETFEDLRIEPSTYRHRIDTMPGPDPDDHVHSAAAVAAEVDALVTNDENGFPIDELAELGVRVIDPDTYLEELYAEFPDDVLSTVAGLARSKTRPPMSPTELLAVWQRAGLHRFPATLRPRI